MSKGLLITGATGKQGGATIDALVATPNNTTDFTILAVTRNATSASAQNLTSKAPNIKLVQGDLNDVPALFSAAKAAHPTGTIDGVFSVQVPMGKGATPQTEEAQGKALIDGALAAGVQHFVYTSVDRGGDVSISTPTHVPHFISKHNIETHLISQTDSSANKNGMSYTILRPVAFMDNITPDFLGKMFATAWKVGLPESKPLQLVAVTDIGHFAAAALTRPEQYRNRAIGLAGDELTFEQADQVLKETTGQPLPITWGFMGKGLLWGVKEMGTMFEFFRDPGYGASVKKCKSEHPGMLSLGEWIEKKSAFAKK